jgi:2,5-furandicarboxylate decarboxylase 1
MTLDFREFLAVLEREGELLRVRREVEPRNFELAAVVRKAEEETGQAVLFERVADYPRMRATANLYGTLCRIALGLGLAPTAEETRTLSRQSRGGPGGMAGCTRASHLMSERERASAVKIRAALERAVADAGRFAPDRVAKSPAQDVVVREDVDILRELPVVWHCMEDRGPFITPGVWVTRDPDTGAYGMGVFRGQVTPETYGPNRMGALFSAHSDTLKRLLRYEEKGQDVPTAIMLGPEPAVQIAAVHASPTGVDEFGVAGALRGSPLPVVSCQTIDLLVPANCEIVLEGRILAGARQEEGPMAEFTDYYREERAPKPVFEVSAITYRRDPIYQTLMSGMSDEHRTLSAIVGWGWEGRVLQKLQREFPTVRAVANNIGSDLFHLVVSMEKRREGDDRRLLHYIMGLDISVFYKYITIVDDDIDVYNPDQVEWARCMRTGRPDDFAVFHDAYTHNLDPMGIMVGPPAHQRLVTSKLGILATRPIGETYRRPGPPDEVLAKVRLDEYR